RHVVANQRRNQLRASTYAAAGALDDILLNRATLKRTAAARRKRLRRAAAARQAAALRTRLPVRLPPRRAGAAGLPPTGHGTAALRRSWAHRPAAARVARSCARSRSSTGPRS